MIIDGKEYNANILVLNSEAVVTFPEELSVETITEIMSATEADSYTLGKLRSVKISDDFTELRWAVENELESVRTQLTDREAKIAAVYRAIRALGTGIPTLTEWATFLRAVKEAINYDRTA